MAIQDILPNSNDDQEEEDQFAALGRKGAGGGGNAQQRQSAPGRPQLTPQQIVDARSQVQSGQMAPTDYYQATGRIYAGSRPGSAVNQSANGSQLQPNTFTPKGPLAPMDKSQFQPQLGSQVTPQMTPKPAAQTPTTPDPAASNGLSKGLNDAFDNLANTPAPVSRAANPTTPSTGGDSVSASGTGPSSSAPMTSGTSPAKPKPEEEQ